MDIRATLEDGSEVLVEMQMFPVQSFCALYVADQKNALLDAQTTGMAQGVQRGIQQGLQKGRG